MIDLIASRRSGEHPQAVPEGTAYYERVAVLLRELEDAADRVGAPDSDPRGLPRVSVTTDLSRMLVAGWIEQFV